MGMQIQRGRAFKYKLLVATLSLFALAAWPIYGLLHAQIAAAVAATVTPANNQGWVASSDSGGKVEFVTDGTAPVGSGALKLTTNSTTSSVARLTHAFDMPLSDISTLSFQTKQVSAADTANGNVTMRINIDTDNDGTFDDQLMFEPYYNGFNGTTQTGWKTWNVATGKLWSNWEKHYNGLGGVGAGSYASNFTIADVLHDYPSAKLTGLVVSMGTWNVSQQVLADNVIVNGDVYDFEPATITACSTTNTVNFDTLSSWNLSETRATGHNELTTNGLHVWTEGATSTDKAAGYYPVSFNLADLGEGFGLDATAISGTTPPALQLTVDLDGNGTPEGNLVGEPAAYGANTLWLSSNWTGIDLSSAPTTINGGGTGKGGTVNAWLSAFPNAKIVAVGYSLGSGVHGDYTITKLTAGCTNYTFSLDTTPPAVPVHVSPANNSSINYNDFYFDWSNVGDAVEYEFQSSHSSSVDANGALNSGVWNNKLNGASGQNHLTDSRIHSYGANGTWYWQVRAIDAAGNKSAWTTPWKLTIDMEAPATPTNLSWKTNTNVVIPNGGATTAYSGTASWQGSSDVDHYIYKYWNDISGNPYKAGSEYTSNVSGTSLPGAFNQGEGVHHFCIVAVDAAGNKSACSAPFTITYDITAPDVPTLLSPANGVPVNGTTPIANKWNAVSEADHYIYQSYNVKPDGTCNYASIRWTATYSAAQTETRTLADGLQYCWRVKAIDAAGNESGWSDTWKTVVDNITPDGSVTVTGNDVLATATLGSLTEEIKTPAGWTKNGSEYTRDHTANGSYSVTIEDFAGNSKTINYSVTSIDDIPPVVNVTNVVRNSNGSYTITGTTSDSTDTVNLVIDGVTPLVATVSGSNWTAVTSVLPDGPHSVSATSQDTANNIGTLATPYLFTAYTPFDGNGDSVNGVNSLDVTGLRGARNASTGTTLAQALASAANDNAQANDDQEVLGTQTAKKAAALPAVAATSEGWKIFGIAWYWWLLAIVLLAALWWLIAARRRRKRDDE